MRKKIFAILMSAMMMVTFMPAMAFAGDEAPAKKHDPKVTSITWNTDYESAYVTIEGQKMDRLVKAEVKDAFSKDNDTNVFVKAEIKEEAIEKAFGVYDVDWTSETELQAVKYVIDFSKAGIVVENTTVDAGDYSAWKANENNAEALAYWNLANPAEVKGITINGKFLPTTYEKFVTITYPEYQAYDFAATGANLTGEITVTPAPELINLIIAAGDMLPEAWKNIAEDMIVVKETVAKQAITFDVTPGLNDYYTYWDCDFSEDNFVGFVGRRHNRTAQFIYDGKAHTAAFLFDALNTTDTFKYEKLNAETDKFEEVDEVKNVGTYKISVKRVLDKDLVVKKTFEDDALVTILPKEVDVQPVATKFWKNYDGEGFTFTDKMFKIEGLCDGDTLLKAPFTTEAHVGEYLIMLADKDVNENYTVHGNVEVTATIVKADNKVTCPTSNKAVKYSKVKKAAQTVAVKTTSKFGEVKLTKVSGSARLYVKDGKIVVKKGTKKGTYKIKVRAYVEGTENYASAKITKVVKVKVK